MQRIEIFILGIDSVSCESSAQSVGTVVHRSHRIGDFLAGHFISFSGDNGGDSAAGGDSYLTFYFHIVSFPFREIEKRKDAHFGTERTVLK